MSQNNKVLWSEGLFLRPQHFQQHDRFVEWLVEQRAGSLRSNAWGFTELQIDQGMLAIGKLAITAAAGVFPDGTPFCMPADDPLPAPIDLDERVRDKTVFLSIPLRRAGSAEFVRGADPTVVARFQARDVEANDTSGSRDSSAVLEVGTARTSLLLEDGPLGDYAAIPVVRVLECRADKRVVLVEQFIPTVLNAHVASRLKSFVSELRGLLHQRGEELSGRVSAAGQGSSELSNFLMLQAINRYEPLIAHWATSSHLHPEDLFQALVQIGGEFLTFTGDNKRCPEFPPYRHDRLRETFEPVFAALRRSFTAVLVEAATPIQIIASKSRYGFSSAMVAERTLLEAGTFVLAVKADMPAEEVRRVFPQQTKVGPGNLIVRLVESQMPGIPLQPLPVAPRQIPYHAGYTYFELDRNGELARAAIAAGGFGMHVGGQFPGLKIEMWGIRG
ncbi:MAG: type VI secretion system baseplate subunit TssK [Gammaproteobacteria bacterium]|nr:type VI secretion system baseplate subunit TssK [Gammaproteobacteria bacterium]